MYEIITLSILSIKIGDLAKRKGESIWRWRMYNILAFLAGDIIGVTIGMSLYGMERWYMILLLVIPLSIAGYHIVRTILQNLPDRNYDELDQIGENLQS